MKKAFTIIEIMIVVAIVATFALVAIPNFIAYLQTSKVNICRANINLLNRATEAYLVEHPDLGMQELTLDMLAPQKTSKDSSKFYLKARPECPVGGTYNYNVDAQSWVCSRDGGM